MEDKQIRNIFRRKFNNQPNMMTPNFIRFGECGKYIYELSSGEGIFNREEKIFGVTFLTKEGGRPKNDLATCCSTMEEVEEVLIKQMEV